jgi:hypothetical protein
MNDFTKTIEYLVSYFNPIELRISLLKCPKSQLLFHVLISTINYNREYLSSKLTQVYDKFKDK